MTITNRIYGCRLNGEKFHAAIASENCGICDEHVETIIGEHLKTGEIIPSEFDGEIISGHQCRH